MTTLAVEQTQTAATAATARAADLPIPERPRLAPGVSLVGEMRGTGFVDRQWLVQRGDRYLQVTELLYRVAEHADGERTVDGIAASVTSATPWEVTDEHVRHILRAKLIPLGLVAGADGAVAPREESRRSPLQIDLRRRVLGAEGIDVAARVLRWLFAPPVLVAALAVVAVAYGWLYLVHGVSDPFRAALYTPGGLLVVLAVTTLSGVVHELGHASALRYGGGRAREMGVGIYLVYPTFYTDTTDAYRLGRWARLRTDLGGIYFHLLFGLALIGLYHVTGNELLLAVVLVVSADIAYQLIPYVRLDGYWALADLTGVPDFFSQAGPFLRGTFAGATASGHAGGQRLPELRRGAKVAFLTYLAVCVPALALILVAMLNTYPRFLRTTWTALRYQQTQLAPAWRAHDALLAAAVLAQMAMLLLALGAAAYFLVNLVRQVAKGLRAWRAPLPVRRAVGTLGAVGGAAFATTVWVPQLIARPLVVPDGVRSFDIVGRRHVTTSVAYPENPPVGGDHYPIWQNCGFYDAPIGPEKGVHALEHGAVWITYAPDLPRDQVELLRHRAHHATHVLVSPYPGLPAPVVASAWGFQARLQSARDPRLDEFVRTFRLGPQAPESGGPCTGGIGWPK